MYSQLRVYCVLHAYIIFETSSMQLKKCRRMNKTTLSIFYRNVLNHFSALALQVESIFSMDICN